MTQGRLIGLGVVVGAVATVAIIIGFNVERSAANLGVVAVVCVALGVALVHLVSDPSHGSPLR